jgi:hypothetical protein
VTPAVAATAGAGQIMDVVAWLEKQPLPPQEQQY